MSNTPTPPATQDANKQLMATIFGVLTILISLYGIFNLIKSNVQLFSDYGVPPLQFIATSFIWIALDVLFVVGGVMILQGKSFGWALGTMNAAIHLISILFSTFTMLSIDASYLWTGWESFIYYGILAFNIAYLIYVYTPSVPGYQGFRKDHRDLALGIGIAFEIMMRVLQYLIGNLF